MPKGGNSNWKFNFGRGAREELKRKIRATDAKEVGVENPAEETYCYPNGWILEEQPNFVNP